MNAIKAKMAPKNTLVATLSKEDINNQSQISNLSKFLQEKGLVDLKVEIKHAKNNGKVLLDYYDQKGSKQTVLDTTNDLKENDFTGIEETIQRKKKK